MTATATLPPSVSPARIKRTPCPPPGIYENTPFDEYASWDAMNKSTLGQGERSMAHLEWAIKYAREFNNSKALDYGQAVHLAILEPHKFLTGVACKPDGLKLSTKAGIAWKDQHAGKIILSNAEYQNALRSAERVAKHAEIGPLLSGGRVLREVAVVWHDTETGVLCKCRIDLAIKHGKTLVMPDIKTTRAADEFSFAKSIRSFGYDMQAAMTTDGLKATTGCDGQFLLAAIEKPSGAKQDPCIIEVYRPCDKSIESGRIRYRELLAKYVICQATGVWPSRHDGIKEISIPRYGMLGEDDENDPFDDALNEM